MLNTHKIVYELLTFVIGRCKLEETYMTQHFLATITPIVENALLLRHCGWNRPEKSKSLVHPILQLV